MGSIERERERGMRRVTCTAARAPPLSDIRHYYLSLFVFRSLTSVVSHVPSAIAHLSISGVVAASKHFEILTRDVRVRLLRIRTRVRRFVDAVQRVSSRYHTLNLTFQFCRGENRTRRLVNGGSGEVEVNLRFFTGVYLLALATRLV